MLKELSIKNFAIIDDLKIEFTKGLNLLTGETGSGKSIIIEALGIVLGGRGSKDLIRTGEDKAIIEALFFIGDEINETLSLNGFDSEDNILIVTKEIFSNYPSISRINGRPVTLNILGNITSSLVDIFGQHEHQSLLNISNHQVLIDSFGDKAYKNILDIIKQNFNLLKKEKEKLIEMNISSHEREREIDLLKFQIEEIESAKLQPTDDVDIENDFKKLSNIVDITAGLGEVVGLLNSNSYDNSSVLEMIDKNINILNNLNKFDKDIEPYLSRFQETRYELQDLARELSFYMENLEIDEEQLIYLRDRLDIINRLKKKYGSNVTKINEYLDSITIEYEMLINYEKEIEKIQNNIKKIEIVLLNDSMKLRDIRKVIGKSLEDKISIELMELNMGKVIFKVNFEERADYTSSGLDYIEFLISTNPGENLKPLSKIVSGGEMSRIMLGFKSIIADNDKMPTLIFDEIDTGISGRTAQIVGEKISKISKNHQVISISHLPQIAALADSHFVISKDILNDKAITKIDLLSETDRITEMARLLGGVDVTNTTLKHAKEMLDMSKKIKDKK